MSGPRRNSPPSRPSHSIVLGRVFDALLVILLLVCIVRLALDRGRNSK
jgi:hypothetical protein